MSKNCAVPLCLPNNCKWDEQTGEHSTNEEEERTSLYVVNAALERLRSVKGPVCVVSIAGPCRKGKSYILSKVFDQGEVFPLGHKFDPKTMGIWLWIVPEKFQDASGQEFTVVLLDSEGIDATSGDHSDDHCIFTLTVLLASVLIYNSAGVPTRTDLDKLDYIVKLSQRIQIYSGNETSDVAKASSEDDNAKAFHKSFPFFVWLLRDVVLALPEGCHSLKDYFLTKVFKTSGPKADKAKEVAESILSYFPGFDAFPLPIPSSDPDVVLNLNRDEVQDDVSKSFIRGVDEFKSVMRSKLTPKHSFNEAEFVTGEALVIMVTSYITALNTPGTVPNVQNAWDVFVSTQCTKAKKAAVEEYDKEMKMEMSGKLPCERDIIRQAQLAALERALKVFEEETFGISTANIDKYLNELTAYMENGLNSWQERNTQLTKDSCKQLLIGLKHQYLDPVLIQLRGKDGAKVSFAEVMGCYSAIEQGFKAEATGAEDVCAQVFLDFHPELQNEMEKHMEHLQQLKDFDKNLAYEKEARAQEMEQRKRVEEEKARLEEELIRKEKEMELLKVKQEEDRRRLEKQLRSKIEEQGEQMQNMMRANMEQLHRERQIIVDQNRTMQEALSGIQRLMNEGNDQKKNIERQIQQNAMERHMEHSQQLKVFKENLAYEKEARAQEMEQRKRVEEEKARLEEERIRKEKEMELLKVQQLKVFKENLAYEKEARAQEMEQRKRVEEEKARLEEERIRKEKEMELLKVKQEEDRRRLEKQLRSKIEEQGEQMQNMMSVEDQNRTMQEAMSGMQRSVNEKDDQIKNLERQIQQIASRRPPSPPKKKEECVVV